MSEPVAFEPVPPDSVSPGPGMTGRETPALRRHSPLEGAALPQDGTFSVSPAPAAARFLLRGEGEACSALGLAAPARLRTNVAGGRSVLWLGPDEFLLLAAGEDAAEIQPGMAEKLAGLPHSLVDVSQRQIGLVLAGRLAARCLSAGCPLDLRPHAFPIGMVARTIFLKAEIILWRQAEDSFHVEVWRSFAPYLIGHLGEARIGATGL